MLDLDMGVHAAYVWPAWGISALVMGLLVLRTVLNARRRKRALDRLEGPRP